MENVKYGFGYDLWVFCLEQAKRTADIPGNTNIRIAEHGDTRLHGIFDFTCDSEGQFYNLTTMANELGGTLFLKENDVLNNSENQENPFSFSWMTQEEKDDIKYLSFDETYIHSLEHILIYLLEQSPIGKLYVGIRCQGLGKENIIGTLSVDRFMNGIIKPQLLLGNVIYILSKTADMNLAEYPYPLEGSQKVYAWGYKPNSEISPN